MFIRPIIALTLLGVAFQAGAVEDPNVDQTRPGEGSRSDQTRPGEESRSRQARGLSGTQGDRSATKMNPKEQDDGTWLSISGTASEPTDDSFTLNYGNGEITVTMNNMDWYNEAVHDELDGSKVTVRGVIDDGWFVSASINATSVYAESLGSYFQSNDSGNHNEGYSSYTATEIKDGDMTVRGKVTTVSAEEETFTINTGARQLTVSVSDLDSNPLDQEGYQKVEVGDRVSVNGQMEGKMTATSELKANRVVSLTSQQRSMGESGAPKRQGGQKNQPTKRGQTGQQGQLEQKDAQN